MGGTSSQSQSSEFPDGAKCIEGGPVRTKEFVPTMPTVIKYTTGKRLEVLPWNESTIWRTPLKDIVMIGTGSEILLVNSKLLTIFKCDLEQMRIHGGVCVDTGKTILRVDTSSTENVVCLVNIDIVNYTANVEPAAWFKVTDPKFVFRADKNQYGILCEKPCRVEIFKLKDILIEDILISSRTMILDSPNAGGFDKACGTPDGNICVMAHRDRFVHIYNAQGDKVKLLEEAPGSIFQLTSVQCGDDGRVWISHMDGDMHVYDSGRWDVVTRGDKEAADHAVVTETRIWAITKDILHIYKIIT